MKLICSSLLLLSCFFCLSVSAQQTTGVPVSQQLSLGNVLSNVEVFVFTDFLCPICKQLEPRLEAMTPKIMEVAQLHFVDVPLHDNSQYFIRYNVSFLLNNKNDYLKGRQAVDKLTDQTDKPTDEQLQALIKDKGITYKPLSQKQLDEITNYNLGLLKEYKVKATPTIVIINNQTKETKTLRGPKEITEENVLETIQSLKKKN